VTILSLYSRIRRKILSKTMNNSVTIHGIPEEILIYCMRNIEFYHYNTRLDDTATNDADNTFYVDYTMT
jgi:hypothetical protein